MGPVASPAAPEDIRRPFGPISGGIVAHNDAGRIGAAIASLLSQELPDGAYWDAIWVVASGCTDGTAEVARRLATADARLRVIEEAERRGKSAALREVLRRARGNALVLLNSDAVAAPGAVRTLLRVAEGKSRPHAVMARPIVAGDGGGSWEASLSWMWQLHHEFHSEILADGRGAHLSDELLLLSLPAPPLLEDGVINDGAYCAVWLQAHGGSCWYAPEALVAIDVPRSPSDHLRQRRRIHVGNAQIAGRLGRRPTTLLSGFLAHPERGARALRRAVDRPGGVRHFAAILFWELAAVLLAAWDRLPPRPDHIRWRRIPAASPPAASSPAGAAGLERRVRALLRVGREFRTPVSTDELAALFPVGPESERPDVAGFLGDRPGIAEPDDLPSAGSTDRFRRGAEFRARADVIAGRTLGWLAPATRCIGLTGSTAYGAPEPGDDIDFFVVTRSGATAWFLAATYVSMRLERLRTKGPLGPVACFNYIVDDRAAPSEFSRGGGLLFAREALAVSVLRGEGYYRGLLAQTPAIGLEMPRGYAARTAGAEPVVPQPAPFPVRLLNALVYLPLAGYLQLTGLERNARARREGRTSDEFRTVSRPGLIAFRSRRFEELREVYDGASRRVARPGGTSTAHAPGAR